MSITIDIPSELLSEVERAVQQGGFNGPDDFVRWAVEAKLCDLRRDLFYEITDRVKDGLAERGVTPDEVLADFERFRRG